MHPSSIQQQQQQQQAFSMVNIENNDQCLTISRDSTDHTLARVQGHGDSQAYTREVSISEDDGVAPRFVMVLKGRGQFFSLFALMIISFTTLVTLLKGIYEKDLDLEKAVQSGFGPLISSSVQENNASFIDSITQYTNSIP